MTKGLSENRFRRGVEPEFWGDEFDVWTFLGDIAAFYTSKRGLTQVHRGESAGYQNFLSLLTFYKNNGREYWDKGQVIEVENTASRLTLPQLGTNKLAPGQLGPAGKRVKASPLVPKKDGKRVINLDGVIKRVGGVQITYDGWTAVGHFDSFSWAENVERPFAITYNMRFTVNTLSDSNSQIITSRIQK